MWRPRVTSSASPARALSRCSATLLRSASGRRPRSDLRCARPRRCVTPLASARQLRGLSHVGNRASPVLVAALPCPWHARLRSTGRRGAWRRRTRRTRTSMARRAVRLTATDVRHDVERIAHREVLARPVSLGPEGQGATIMRSSQPEEPQSRAVADYMRHRRCHPSVRHLPTIDHRRREPSEDPLIASSSGVATMLERRGEHRHQDLLRGTCSFTEALHVPARPSTRHLVAGNRELNASRRGCGRTGLSAALRRCTSCGRPPSSQGGSGAHHRE
jgi:hypothetical protein